MTHIDMQQTDLPADSGPDGIAAAVFGGETRIFACLDANRIRNLPAMLDELEAKGFLSAERVMESVIHSKSSRFGAARVAQELRQKGLDASLVTEAVERLRGTEHARAQDIWQRRFSTPAQTPQERAKQMRFLASRGFSGDVVRKVVSCKADD